MKRNKINFATEKMTFNTFKELAANQELSKYERIGFPDNYRDGYENSIFENISSILQLDRKNLCVFDIGCGCSELPNLIINNAKNNNHTLFMIDSNEMLSYLPENKYINKIPLKFPDEIKLDKYQNKVDAIILYSVLQHVILEMNPFYFIDKAVNLLKDGGRFLIADIPNISKRNRFFASTTGAKFHKKFTQTNTIPTYQFNMLVEDKVDDSLIFAILSRYRNAGLETYLLEQPNNLPMSNRREDILIVKN